MTFESLTAGAVLYGGAETPAHPGIHLDLTKRALDRKVRMSLWFDVWVSQPQSGRNKRAP